MNIPANDIALVIKSCQRNDRRAQEQLYKMFWRSLAVICMRYTKNQQDGMELLNDAFMKIFKSIAQYHESKGGFYAWASKITINTALDFLRKKQMIIKPMEFDGYEEPAIDNDVIRKMGADELLRLIRQLPPATQAVFNLYTIEGYNHTETATLLGISEGTSKWHLSEARKQLQKNIRLMHQT